MTDTKTPDTETIISYTFYFPHGSPIAVVLKPELGDTVERDGDDWVFTLHGPQIVAKEVTVLKKALLAYEVTTITRQKQPQGYVPKELRIAADATKH